jgi:hypothetical protein
MSELDLELLPDGGVSWLDASGPDAHIVLSTRIRLARNLGDTRFTPRATDPERERILERVLDAGRAAAGCRGSSASCCTSATSSPKSWPAWRIARGCGTGPRC